MRHDRTLTGAPKTDNKSNVKMEDLALKIQEANNAAPGARTRINPIS
jgi:hypothetical protein